MKIAVVGSGAVGGYFGGRLAAAGEEVAFLARGAQLEALRTRGLAIESPNGALVLPAVRATDQPADVGPVDIVLFTVKLYDLDQAAALLPPLIGPTTVVITLQNGVEAPTMLARHVGAAHVAAGAAYIVAVVDAPGHIRHTTAQRLVFGELDGSVTDRLRAFERACSRAGFQGRLTTDITTDLWIKFVRLATWSGMTAVTRSPMGVIRDDPELMSMMASALDEAIAVGRASGVTFPPTLVDETMKMVRGFPPESKSSMLEDLERGRRLELPWLSGAVVRIGQVARVPTPIHGFITMVLGPYVHGTRPNAETHG